MLVSLVIRSSSHLSAYKSSLLFFHLSFNHFILVASSKLSKIIADDNSHIIAFGILFNKLFYNINNGNAFVSELANILWNTHLTCIDYSFIAPFLHFYSISRALFEDFVLLDPSSSPTASNVLLSQKAWRECCWTYPYKNSWIVENLIFYISEKRSKLKGLSFTSFVSILEKYLNLSNIYFQSFHY